MQMINSMQVMPDWNYRIQEVYESLSILSNHTHYDLSAQDPVSRQLISPLVSAEGSSQVSLDSEAQNVKYHEGEVRWLCDKQFHN